MNIFSGLIVFVSVIKVHLVWCAFRYMGFDVRKPVFGVCKQQRSRPACTYVQADQRLCYLLIVKYHI